MIGFVAEGMTYRRTTASEEETRQLAATLAKHLCAGDVIVLQGDLGAGKTRFVQGLAEGIGIADPVVSPTFTLLSEYRCGRLPLYHFDLYRLDDANQLDDIGYFESLEGDGVSCVEWGDKFPQSSPHDYLSVELFRCSDLRALSDGSGRKAQEVSGASPEDGSCRHCLLGTTDAADDAARVIIVRACGCRAQKLIAAWICDKASGLERSTYTA